MRSREKIQLTEAADQEDKNLEFRLDFPLRSLDNFGHVTLLSEPRFHPFE